ncbi:PRKC apoptosis WT1 regulator protein [Cottoperca gobio]|uniref:PRKC apoptosis WT1 regulator protein n=1 Tax=Cottoperca gobio TaxID=56716 RepID=A0A6J2S9F3_COTGO|nr:PRKC apoptosis WT1 regulator protein [Cottoperca gobio]
MATGGFKSNATTDFLEEWKAKREKMRAKMLGDIAAATGAPMGASNPNGNNNSNRHAAPPGTDLTNNGNPERSASAGNCLPSSYTVARSSSGTALKRPEEETHHPAHTASPTAATPPGSNPKKAPPQTEKAQCASPDLSPMACIDSDKGSPSPSKVKEKNSTGPRARKGQIEKRKLREKRRSTGVVSIPSNESLDELDDDDAVEKNRKEEEELVQANTFQNEAMMADPATGHLMETPRTGSGRHKSGAAGPGSEEEVGGNSRQRHNRHGRDGTLEKRMEELEKELARERQETDRLLKAHQDKDDLIGKLKEEIDLLNRDLDDIEDENEQLKQENKTLLKVVGQLTR